ncbi:MAG: hypothetical protein KJO35_02165, partial [Gammaproteobacteria bacterium]|nr:hypothetical protein [Gammaproteobacteria bacterium]
AVPLVTRLPIRFEDGPRDCEAVAVDVASDRVLLVSKSDFPPRLYELPLTLIKGIRRPLVARHVAVIPAMPRPTLAEFLESPLLGPWRHQPTALDVSRNGAVLGLMTFRNLYLFRRQPAQRWGEVVMATPLVLELPELSQTESVSFVGDRAITVAEGRSAQIISLGPLSAHLGRNVGPM